MPRFTKAQPIFRPSRSGKALADDAPTIVSLMYESFPKCESLYTVKGFATELAKRLCRSTWR